MDVICRFFEIFTRLKTFAQNYCSGKIAVILEGGYDLEAASSCGLAVTKALLDEDFADELGDAPFPNSDAWEPVLEKIKDYWDM